MKPSSSPYYHAVLTFNHNRWGCKKDVAGRKGGGGVVVSRWTTRHSVVGVMICVLRRSILLGVPASDIYCKWGVDFPVLPLANGYFSLLAPSLTTPSLVSLSLTPCACGGAPTVVACALATAYDDDGCRCCQGAAEVRRDAASGTPPTLSTVRPHSTHTWNPHRHTHCSAKKQASQSLKVLSTSHVRTLRSCWQAGS